MERSVCVQVVLYQNEPASTMRLGRAIAATVRNAKKLRETELVQLAFGDCSPKPLLASEAVGALTSELRKLGLDDVSYTFFDANLGSAGGSNRLALTAATDFLWIVNPDAYPAPSALTRLLEAISDDGVAAAEARQIPIEHPKAYDTETGDTSWASGCCSLVRRVAFDEVGGFDDKHFFLHCDDVDFSWRIRLAGWRVVHTPGAVVFHDLEVDTSGDILASPYEQFHGALGRLLLAQKYDRPDVIEETADAILDGGTREQKQALSEFRRRQLDDLLPIPLDGAHRVAQFVRGEYAHHRF